MEAGRELDALIHEKVLGLAAHEEDAYENWIPIDPPKYSIDIAAAWLMVEKLDAVFRLERRWISGNAFWWCEAGTMTYGGSHAAIAESAPLAICLAALKAIDAI